jgi:hypothetical protein
MSITVLFLLIQIDYVLKEEKCLGEWDSSSGLRLRARAPGVEGTMQNYIASAGQSAGAIFVRYGGLIRLHLRTFHEVCE